MLSNPDLIKHDNIKNPITRDEFDQIKTAIANIPKLVERIMNVQF